MMWPGLIVVLILSVVSISVGNEGGGKNNAVEDHMEEFPNYGMITSIEDLAVQKIADIWTMTEVATEEERRNRTYINEVFWPGVLQVLRDAHFAMRDMDNKILFERKPSTLMDALLKLETLRDLQRLVMKDNKSPEDHFKIRFMEVSSAATQMHRFYAKRIRDILRDEPRLGMVANSILTYKGFTWGSNKGQSGFSITSYIMSLALTDERLMYMGGKKDIFLGIREMLEKQPDVVLKAQFEGKVCQNNETLYNIEPAGLDGPYYVLFHLCLVDIKFYVLSSFAYLYGYIFKGESFQDQAALRDAMRTSVQRKIDLFDHAFAKFMNGTGPSYQQYPGVGICDPPPGPDGRRNWEYDESYIKLTNFIKVFVAREQTLHRAGNCMQTCDVLDATYKICPQADVDCIFDEELDCLTKKQQCEDFDPPCPAGQYQCQNASSIMQYCPSTRYDRLYEYIRGWDFLFGPEDVECETQAVTVRGSWKMEQDILMDTPHFCDICTCYCFEPLVPYLGDFSVRYISLAASNARFKKGFIVAGVKFERIEDQIHILVADALPLPGNKVNTSTISWHKPKKITKPNELARLDRDLRSFNLDDVVTHDPDRVLTGVKFFTTTYLGHVRYNYFGIMMLSHPITPEGVVLVNGTKKGSFLGKQSRNANSTAFRSLYKYADDPDGPDDPILAVGPSLPDTTSNQYIVFVGSSLTKDAGQTTVPFFDSQKLIRKEPKWLKGVGVYHKSRPGFGGFLSLKLIEHHDE